MSNFLDNVREIFYYLRQYKSRTLMTMFGIVWGTVTIVVLLAFGVGVKGSMSKSMHGIGEGIVIMFPGRTSIPYKGFARDRYIHFSEEDAFLLKREIRGIASVSPEYSTWEIPVRVGSRMNKPNITGIIPEYGPMRNIWPQPGGRWIDDLDIKDRKRVVFLGNDLKDILFGKSENVIGKYVYIGETPFLVIGVLKKKTQNSSYNSRDKDRAFIPASTFASMFGHKYINDIIYKHKDPRMAKLTNQRVYEVLGKKYRFDPKDKQALYIWDTSELDKFVFYFSLGFNLFLGLIGILTLTVGGIGLANIMYVVVKERTREIGIRRSVGAKKRHIMNQFILETFIIVGLSAAIGFVVAVVTIKIVSLFPIEEYVGYPVLSLPVAIVSISILGIIGFLAGYFPSRKAAGMEIVECMRY